MRTTLRWAVCGALVIAGVTGCSDDGSDSTDQPKVRSAAQVCDGALTPAAATALSRIGGTGRYTELEGTNDFGDSLTFSTALAAKRLHRDARHRNTCKLYNTGDKSGFPLLDIDFEARTTHSDPDKVAKKHDDDLTLYPLGLYAASRAKSGASLVFACPTKGPEKSTPYVRASMYVSKGQIAPDSTGKDKMTILNAVSRRMAEELGCAAQAKLPAEVPAATSGGG